MSTLSRTTRRTFLWYFLLFIGSALAMMMIWGMGRFLLFRTNKKREREISLDTPSSIEPDVPLHVPAAGVWLVRRGTGEELFALDDRCTHLGCHFKWEAQRSVFECPCHGSEFDLEGKVKRGPATRALQRFSVLKGADGKLRLLEKPSGSATSS